MLIAAILRNVIDGTAVKTPINEISIIGNVCLSLFLSMALMSEIMATCGTWHYL